MFQDVDIPEVAKLNFDSCEFDAEFEQVRVCVNKYFCFKKGKLLSTHSNMGSPKESKSMFIWVFGGGGV